MGGKVDSGTGTGSPFSLTVNTSGTTTFSGQVGSLQPLSSLTTDAGTGGGTTINVATAPAIITTGGQTFGDDVTLGADTTLISASGTGDVTFGKKVDGGFALNVNTAGVTKFNGAVGSTTPLTTLTTNTAGSTQVNGGSVATTVSQSYNDPLSVGTLDATFNAGGGIVAFNNTVTGSVNLTTTGTAGSTTQINGGSVTTPGKNQSLQHAGHDPAADHPRRGLGQRHAGQLGRFGLRARPV